MTQRERMRRQQEIEKKIAVMRKKRKKRDRILLAIEIAILLSIAAMAISSGAYSKTAYALAEKEFKLEFETETETETETEPKTEAETETETETETEEPEWEYLGEFKITAYCPCYACCGQWSGGPTRSGAMPQEGVTAAADWNVLPKGSLIDLGNGETRIVQDTGGGVNGNHIDIYMSDHQSAVNFGVQYRDVWLYVGE